MGKDFIKNEFRFWRYLVDFWSFILFIFVLLDFFYDNSYSDFLNVLSVVYIGSLAIYSGNKEFERWYDRHESKHPGEIFVVIWSVLMFILFFMSLFKGNVYQIPTSVISTYLAVLTILAVTRKSKQVYRARRDPDGKRLNKKRK
jgi:Na+/H+ antiporter NhaD/arsenite permease-like protein